MEREEKIRHDLAKYIGREVNTKHLETDLDRLVGAGRFGRLGYGMTEQNGKIGLAIDATPPAGGVAAGPPLRPRGLDTPTYTRPTPGNTRQYYDTTGTGNSLNDW